MVLFPAGGYTTAFIHTEEIVTVTAINLSEKAVRKLHVYLREKADTRDDESVICVPCSSYSHSSLSSGAHFIPQKSRR